MKIATTIWPSHRAAAVTLPAGTWGYTHDGRGLRTSKVELDAQDEPIESTRVRYLYGPEGLLHGETAPGGTTLASVYIWLNGEPIGLIRNDTLYHIHPDHLGRPEVITDASRNVVWRAVLHPWDRTVATTSIGAYNLGFPGQYRDSESGQWYNYFRTYDGSIGRYTQADPIGLLGGMNTFAYVGANPLRHTDSLGLQADGDSVEGTLTVGFTGIWHSLGGTGGSWSGGVSVDLNGRVCVQVTTCGRVGPGTNGGAGGIFVTGSTRNSCPGQTGTAGVFVDGVGRAGGGGSVDAGPNSAAATVTLRALAGGVIAGGAQLCITNTRCIN